VIDERQYTMKQRWAMIAAAALLASACTAPGSPGQALGPAPPPQPASPGLGDRVAATLSDAIRFVTVNPPGDEAPLAEFFAARLRAAGAEADVIPTPSGASTLGRAAVWGRYAGSGRGAPIVLLSHLDVVPAQAESWEFEPFAGVIRDGYVYGRGAIDAKGAAVVHLATVTELARRGRTLDRDIIFLSVPEEETGGWYGAGYLLREHPKLLRGAGYLLTEGGGVRLPPGDGPPVWGVAITEKNPCWLRVTASGTPGHSSVPPRDAAVPRLISTLTQLQNMETNVAVIPEVAAMFAALAPFAPPEDRAGFADLESAFENDPAFRLRFLSNLQYAALVRATLVPTVLEGSPRTNVNPASATAHVDARLLPGESCSAFASHIRTLITDPGVSVEPILSFPSRTSSADTPLFHAIERVAAAADPGAVVVPRVISGFTDAHYFRDRGLVAYGFIPRWRNADEPWGVHGPDERISIVNLERGVTTLIAILEELDRVEAAQPR
jgi:acetylornithine deacetylase/succinyl-diaminopimelate desuccinylase-like protein